VNSIGQNAGCPQSQKVVYMGVAADCEYTQQYGSPQNATTQILTNWNTASALYKVYTFSSCPSFRPTTCSCRPPLTLVLGLLSSKCKIHRECSSPVYIYPGSFPLFEGARALPILPFRGTWIAIVASHSMIVCPYSQAGEDRRVTTVPVFGIS
jgi:hypothetical protein